VAGHRGPVAPADDQTNVDRRLTARVQRNVARERGDLYLLGDFDLPVIFLLAIEI